MQNLLEKYTEAACNDSRIPATPEKRLCKAYYQTKHERESLLGQASNYITIKYENKKYSPVFDPRYETDVASLHFKILEIDKREEDLLTKIDQISGKFEMDIRGLHDEKKRCEVEIERLILFPSEVEALRARHQVLTEPD